MHRLCHPFIFPAHPYQEVLSRAWANHLLCAWFGLLRIDYLMTYQIRKYYYIKMPSHYHVNLVFCAPCSPSTRRHSLIPVFHLPTNHTPFFLISNSDQFNFRACSMFVRHLLEELRTSTNNYERTPRDSATVAHQAKHTFCWTYFTCSQSYISRSSYSITSLCPYELLSEVSVYLRHLFTSSLLFQPSASFFCISWPQGPFFLLIELTNVWAWKLLRTKELSMLATFFLDNAPSRMF